MRLLLLWLFGSLEVLILKTDARADELPHLAMSACRKHLENAKQKYETSTDPRVILQLRAFESPSWGHHGEPPSVSFSVEGAGNSLDFVWYRGRDNGTRPWVSDDQARFLGSARKGASVILWGTNDSWKSFTAAFQPAAEACFKEFAR